MHRVIIFDDGRGRLGPMTDLRASFEVRTGMFTTAGRIAAAYPRALSGYWAQPALVELLRERANAPVNALPAEEEVLCVNGRWAMPDTSISDGLSVGEAAQEEQTGDIVVALLRRDEADYFLNSGELHERVRTVPVEDRVLYKFPWDVIGSLQQTIPHDILSTRVLDARIPSNSDAIMGDHVVEIHSSAQIGPYVTFDATAGPIMLHEHVVIRPGAVLCGPCSIGANSTVLDHALIKANTVIGPWCKVAGEIGGTIFQGYANKSHDGHLGDSWVGKWANFGAGTTNSNLLNTYGEVVMRLEPEGQRRRTGLNFLGAIVGDHVKFAINTRLMTGSCIGTGAMVATTAAPPTAVRRFAWLTDDGERAFRLDKFNDVARTVMARRNIEPTPAYLGRIADLHQQFAAR